MLFATLSSTPFPTCFEIQAAMQAANPFQAVRLDWVEHAVVPMHPAIAAVFFAEVL